MKHGGDLSQVRHVFSAGDEDWLDLSTGINPLAYPFALPCAESWRRLPQSGALTGLIEGARMAYGASEDAAIAAAPGTQMLIQLLPMLFPAKTVAVVGPTYSEHALCWQMAGADVMMIDDLACLSHSPGMLPAFSRQRRGRRIAPGEEAMQHSANVFERCRVIIIVNPNNPDGRSWTPKHILQCADEMARHGGLLIVDEAFADVQPEMSAVPHAGREGLVVLRSFGKFFGLAGIRLGFAIGARGLVTRMTKLLGPWAVSGPALDIGTQALQDLEWQSRTRRACAEMAAMLDALLADAGFKIIGGTALFRLAHHERAQEIHRDLARQGIWVRRFDDHPDWLRFGLPDGKVGFNRLAAALCM